MHSPLMSAQQRLGLDPLASAEQVRAAFQALHTEAGDQAAVLAADQAFLLAWLAHPAPAEAPALVAAMCAAMPATSGPLAALPWRDALGTVLAAHPALAAEIEDAVAQRLGAGWAAGHEHLLEAAELVFGWHRDRRRLHALGGPGRVLDQALNEAIPFARQPLPDYKAARRLVQRLRLPDPPDIKEVLADLPFLEDQLKRYPHYLQLVCPVRHVQAWRELAASIPASQRAAAAEEGRKAREANVGNPYLKLGRTTAALLVAVVGGISAYNQFLKPAPAPRPSLQALEAARPLRDPLQEALFEARQALRARDYPQALAAYDKAAVLAPRQAAIPGARALVYLDLHDKAAARKAMAQAAALDADEAYLSVAAGRIAFQEGKFDEAISKLSSAIARSSDCIDCRLWRARAYERLRKLDEAMADADAAIAQDLSNYGAYALRASIWEARGEHGKALNQALMAIDAMPKDPGAYEAAAAIYMQLRDPAQALRILETGRRALPQAEGRLYEASGRLQLNLGWPREALAAFEQAVRLTPASAGAHFGLGTAQQQLGQNGDAALAQARRLDPQIGQRFPQP